MPSAPAPPSPLTEDVARFRRFNRMYTRFIGTLQEGLMDTEYSLAEARVLYELATRAALRAKEISESLGMDPGYLSRLLSKFERASLLRRKASDDDSRSSELTLTRQGKAAFNMLNTKSDEQAQAMLESLPDFHRTQLIHAMQTISGILHPDNRSRPSFVLRPHRAGDMGWVVCRESAVYAQEYGFNHTFESLVARIVADFLSNFDPARERCWIADVDGQSVGHIFLVQHPDQPETAKLRLLFVEPSARGLGLGHALVNECLHFARTAGYHKVVLWTQSILAAAHRIYQATGFQLVAEEPHRSFGQNLIGQTWQLDLV